MQESRQIMRRWVTARAPVPIHAEGEANRINFLPTRNAAFFRVKATTSSAAETCRPCISRVTSRTLNGEIRAYLYIDLTSIILKSHWVAHPPGGDHPLLFFPSPNPFLESLHRKFSDAHLPPAMSRFSGHRA